MDVKKVLSDLDRKIAQDAKAAKLQRDVEKGLKVWQAAEEFSSRTGIHAAEVINSGILEQYPDGKIPEDEAKALTLNVCGRVYTYVADVSEKAQQATNDAAGVGLKPLVPEFDRERAEGIGKEIAGYENVSERKEQIRKEIVNNSRSIVDNTIKVNARAHEAAGLVPRVTRVYDGVGLSNGRTCEWCKERCGENMTYQEAYDKGAFQRHPGCGCEILYSVGKRTQRQSNWENNEWEDVQSYDTIEMRKEYSVSNDSTGNQIERSLKEPKAGSVTYGEPIRRSVGAWSVDEFDVINPLTGERIEFVPGSRPVYPKDHLIAGAGSKKAIRQIDRLLELGGTAAEWKHEKAYLRAEDDYGDEAYVEIHWFECPDVPGKHDAVPKVRDGEVFFYDIEEWESRWKWLR